MTALLKETIEKGLYAKIDAYEPEMIDEITKLVAIPSLATSVNAEGLTCGPEITRCLHYALELAERLGFRTHNEDDLFGWAEIGDEGPLVTMFLHMDIVPVGENWTKEPFKVTREGDFLYGRGVLDNKGPAVSILYAIKSCLDLGVRFPYRLRVYFGTTEETGMDDVQVYIKRYGAPDYSFVPDSQFPLSYSEVNTASFQLRKNYDPSKIDSPIRLVDVDYVDHPNGVAMYSGVTLECESESLADETARKAEEFALKNNFSFTVETNGRKVKISAKGRISDHWDDLWTGVPAIGELMLFLDTISVGKEPDEFIHFIADKIGMKWDGSGLGIEDKRESGTLAMGMSGIHLNEFGLSISFFTIFSAELRNEFMFNGIFRKTRPENIDVVVTSMGAGFVRDKNDPFLQTLYKSYCEVTGNSDPIKVCGGTYAKFVPNAIPFGAIFGPEQDICHTPDEHIRVETELMVWTKIYANALLRIGDNCKDW